MALKNNLPELPPQTPEMVSFRKKSTVFGIILFIILLGGIITCVVLQQYIFIAAVVGFVVISELIWLFIMRSYINKVRSLDLKKNFIAAQLVVGRTENIKKAELASVEKKGKAYVLTLKSGKKITTIDGVKMNPEEEDKFFTKKNFPQTKIDL